jgi:hypothetical protein
VEWDGRPGGKGSWVERVILTRRRGGAEEDAEKQREGQNLRARSQRRSCGLAARHTLRWKAGENALTKNQRVVGGFPERRQFGNGGWGNAGGWCAGASGARGKKSPSFEAD